MCVCMCVCGGGEREKTSPFSQATAPQGKLPIAPGIQPPYCSLAAAHLHEGLWGLFTSHQAHLWSSSNAVPWSSPPSPSDPDLIFSPYLWAGALPESPVLHHYGSPYGLPISPPNKSLITCSSSQMSWFLCLTCCVSLNSSPETHLPTIIAAAATVGHGEEEKRATQVDAEVGRPPGLALLAQYHEIAETRQGLKSTQVIYPWATEFPPWAPCHTLPGLWLPQPCLTIHSTDKTGTSLCDFPIPDLLPHCN
jgi:hypothetical protein